ncbi:MAG: Methionyl-tRNA formyltransferase [Candidatus Uhrbacteria bacterium GW2011_GWD2_52_7]|uniref:Methionyl-tRNA formyltransferase n=1 Tax=Candidatus Uhrbacteria bacterium GW2011_GWD2_52_7 TaxID=1618989 RepID=A0A0G1XEK2_9BACT|nr:MAG: Methionyl-tRNA formyltransferase [Candidatus Uhrbacteria bacterium GW2011_GWD2_52_7]
MLETGDIEVAAVVTQQDEPVGRKHVLTPPPVKVLAQEHGIPVWQPQSMKNPAFHATLRQYEADAFVVIAFGRILPQELIDIPKHGVINVHPSLLPKYRGPSPMHAALLAGDSETGVCVMQIDAQMDHGPVLSCERMAIDPLETIESLTKKVVDVGAPQLISSLRAFIGGVLTPIEQDHTQATFCKLLSREDGVITWTDSAEVIERKIRALNPWPSTSTLWTRRGEDVKLKILNAKIGTAVLAPGYAQTIGNQLYIGTGTTAILVKEIQPAGSKPMDASAFIRGYADIHGALLHK